MMKFNIRYMESQEFSMHFSTILFEAADLETCKKAVNQWRVRAFAAGKKILILSIAAA